ncbi:hypothetical protein SAY86_001437 [Trapa natans]|uniref:Bifunctional inhibitor/plant lipid transfer protein/seed storage helical domain-containing protein n=1 Tax=Trapa natans TaxID=22666 RepID=A0AAN7MDI0_TRANT|nr:hypothetical protein SAY86_001437 [Trapa natans]
MATGAIFLLVLALVAVTFSETSNAQTICNVPLSSLMACTPAATPPNPLLPTASCCSSLLHVDMGCICSYKNPNIFPSLGIDPNLAMQILTKCNLCEPASY